MTKESVEVKVNGCLFDLDGTLVDTQEAVENFWRKWAADNNLNAEEVMAVSHGTRTIEVLKHFTPETATFEKAAAMEAKLPDDFGKLGKAIPGGKQLIQALPKSQWGIVTSGTVIPATFSLTKIVKLEIPEVFITGESVTEGKPHPAGYKMGAERLGLEKFVVFEDAPAGIKAGKAAGATVIGLATTYDAETVAKAGADLVIRDLTHVRIKSWDADTKSLVLEVETY